MLNFSLWLLSANCLFKSFCILFTLYSLYKIKHIKNINRLIANKNDIANNTFLLILVHYGYENRNIT